jgi:hypothetical protein
MNAKQDAHYKELCEIATQTNWTILSDKYVSAKDIMVFKCPQGHIKEVPAGNFKRKQGCLKYPGPNSLRVKAEFMTNIQKLGGTVLGTYLNAKTPVECICIRGHNCTPTANAVNNGRSMCHDCVEVSYEVQKQECEEKYRQLVIGYGAQLIKYNGSNMPMDCICVNGHKCSPYPCTLVKDAGICAKCAGTDPETAANNFIQYITFYGGKLLEPYTGTHKKVKCMCKYGHLCFPTPHRIREGGGLCSTCSGYNSLQAAIKFYENVRNLGGTPIGDYIKSHRKVECRCKKGHSCYPYPANVQNGGGLCRTCNDSKGERMVAKVLDILQIPFLTQVKHPNIRRVKFDICFVYKGFNTYIEIDGIQHQEYTPYFHKSGSSFEYRRQRDLIKNYVCFHNPNDRLIRLDHRWVNYEKTDDQLLEYLKPILDDVSQKIVGKLDIYTWLHDIPSVDTYNSYVISQTHPVSDGEVDEDEDEEDEPDEDEDETHPISDNESACVDTIPVSPPTVYDTPLEAYVQTKLGGVTRNHNTDTPKFGDNIESCLQLLIEGQFISYYRYKYRSITYDL